MLSKYLVGKSFDYLEYELREMSNGRHECMNMSCITRVMERWLMVLVWLLES
jgi:hypothetical protein